MVRLRWFRRGGNKIEKSSNTKAVGVVVSDGGGGSDRCVGSDGEGVVGGSDGGRVGWWFRLGDVSGGQVEGR